MLKDKLDKTKGIFIDANTETSLISNKEILIYLFISFYLSIVEISIPTGDITYKQKLIWYLSVFCFFYIHIIILLIINLIFKFIDIKSDKVKKIIKVILHILVIAYILLLIYTVLVFIGLYSLFMET